LAAVSSRLDLATFISSCGLGSVDGALKDINVATGALYNLVIGIRDRLSRDEIARRSFTEDRP